MLTIVGLILSISILVVVHEWGHYQVARWCGVPVLAFSVGFGTVLFRHRDKRGCVCSILEKEGMSVEHQVDRILSIDLEQKNKILADHILPSGEDLTEPVRFIRGQLGLL